MTESKTERKRGGWGEAGLLALLFAVVLILHAGGLSGSFVYDDHRVIESNPRVIGSGPWTQIFAEQYWGVDSTKAGLKVYYRPLFILMLRAVHGAFGVAPLGYHLVSLALHFCACLLLFFVARRGGLSRRACLVAASAFALHPITVQAVAWASCMSDLMVLVLGLASILGVDHFLRARSKSSLVAVALAYGAALLTLERAALLIVPLLGWAWLKGDPGAGRRETAASSLRRIFPLLASLMVALALVVAGRVVVLGSPASQSMFQTGWWPTLPTVLQRYALNLIAPTDLAIAYPEHRLQSFETREQWIALGMSVALALGALVVAKGSRIRSYAVVSAAALFAPALLFGTLAGYALVQDRYLHAPWAFLALVVGDLAFPTQAPATRLAALLPRFGVGLLLVGWLAAFPSARSPYSNDLALYERAVQRAPGCAHFLMNLANERRRRHAPDDACALLLRARSALESEPSLGDAPLLHFNLGNCLRDHRRTDEALLAYSRALEVTHGAMLAASVNATLVLLEVGRKDEALVEATAAARTHPGDAMSHRLVAIVRLGRGEPTEARIEAERALELAPGDPQTLALLRSMSN